MWFNEQAPAITAGSRVRRCCHLRDAELVRWCEGRGSRPWDWCSPGHWDAESGSTKGLDGLLELQQARYVGFLHLEKMVRFQQYAHKGALELGSLQSKAGSELGKEKVDLADLSGQRMH